MNHVGRRVGGDEVRAGIRDGIRLWRAVEVMMVVMVVDLKVRREISSGE